MTAADVRLRYDRKATDTLLLCLSFIAGCLILFAMNRWGTPSSDELYQTISVRRYREAPLGMLVFWIGNLWTSVFGFSIIALRNLLSFEELLLMSFSSWWLLRQTSSIRLTALVFLTGCVLLRAETFTIYNWDAGAYLFDTLSLCLLISTIGRPRPHRFFLLGVSLALVGLARVPTSVCIPFVFILIWKACKSSGMNNSGGFKAFLLTAAGLAVAFLTVTTLMCGSPTNYVSAFSPENIITGHSPFDDTAYLIDRFRIMTTGMPTLWMPGLCCILLPVIATRLDNCKRILLLLCLTAYCAMLIFFIRIGGASLHVGLGMGAPVAIGLILAYPVRQLFKKTGNSLHKCSLSETRLSLWACALMGLSVMVGSDAFAERICSGIILAPVFGVIWRPAGHGFKRYLEIALLFILTCFSAMTATYYSYLIRHLPAAHVTGVPPFDGLHVTNNFMQELEIAGDAVREVRSQGVPYLYLGDRRLFEIAVGADEGPGFQVYHHYPIIYNDWIGMKDTLLNKIDAVVYIENGPYPDMQAVVDDIKKSGFTENRVIDGTVILSRKKRLLPDKAYTDNPAY